MIFGYEAWVFWLVLMIAFLVIEALTVNMTTIWFAAGCLAAIGLDLLNVPLPYQAAAALVLSAALLLLYILAIKPRFGPRGGHIVPTNTDRFIGIDALVTEAIDPIAGTGLIKALGQVWSAASEDSRPVARGTLATIVEIRGVKAVVRPKPADQQKREESV